MFWLDVKIGSSTDAREMQCSMTRNKRHTYVKNGFPHFDTCSQKGRDFNFSDLVLVMSRVGKFGMAKCHITLMSGHIPLKVNIANATRTLEMLLNCVDRERCSL